MPWVVVFAGPWVSNGAAKSLGTWGLTPEELPWLWPGAGRMRGGWGPTSQQDWMRFPSCSMRGTRAGPVWGAQVIGWGAREASHLSVFAGGCTFRRILCQTGITLSTASGKSESTTGSTGFSSPILLKKKGKKKKAQINKISAKRKRKPKRGRGGGLELELSMETQL